MRKEVQKQLQELCSEYCGCRVELEDELIEKLNASRPENIADLSRISGMTPAGIMVVLRKIKGGNK